MFAWSRGYEKFVSVVLVVYVSKFFPRFNPFVASLYPRMDIRAV